MKKYILRILLAAIPILMFYLAGCGGEDTDPVAPGESQSYLPDIPSFSNANGVMLTIYFPYEVSGIPIEFSMAYAKFGSAIDAGAVTVNGQSVRKLLSDNIYTYNSFDPENPSSISGVLFNGSSHTWNVAGAGTIPAISNASVTSINDFNILSPSDGTTVTKTNGMNVQWSSQGNAQSVIIKIKQGNSTLFSQQTTDTGSLSIDAGTLSSMSGNVKVIVMKYSSSTNTVGSNNYVTACEVLKEATVTLQ